MVLDYSLKVFLIIFFSLIGAAIVFSIPLIIVLIMHLAKEDGVRKIDFGKCHSCFSRFFRLCFCFSSSVSDEWVRMSSIKQQAVFLWL